jgi:hypothetical protein
MAEDERAAHSLALAEAVQLAKARAAAAAAAAAGAAAGGDDDHRLRSTQAGLDLTTATAAVAAGGDAPVRTIKRRRPLPPELEIPPTPRGYRPEIVRCSRETVWGSAALTVGTVVTCTFANEGMDPAGTCGEIVEIKKDGRMRVRFPAGTGNLKPEHLVLATPEQVAQWRRSEAPRVRRSGRTGTPHRHMPWPGGDGDARAAESTESPLCSPPSTPSTPELIKFHIAKTVQMNKDDRIMRSLEEQAEQEKREIAQATERAQQGPLCFCVRRPQRSPVDELRASASTDGHRRRPPTPRPSRNTADAARDATTRRSRWGSGRRNSGAKSRAGRTPPQGRGTPSGTTGARSPKRGVMLDQLWKGMDDDDTGAVRL